MSRSFARALFTAPVRRVRHIDRLERLEERENPAPVATVTGLPAVTQPLLGDTVNYGLTFTNTGPDTGFAPFLELGVDTTGADNTAGGLPQDGVGTPVVTVAGLTLSPRGSVTLVAGQTTFTNPITGEAGRPVPTGLGAGDIITFYALPFGSFTPAQSTAVNITLPTSNRADLNTPLPVSVAGGFRDDDPSLAGPAFYGARADGAISPQLYTLRKIYQGPESETATGPNYVRRYRLEVDIATGQTVTDLRINDVLADSMQLVARDATVIAGNPNIGVFLGGAAVAFVPARLTATGGAATGAPVPTAPGGSITYNFIPTGSYTSIAGVDAALEFNFYVPRDRNPAGAPDAPDPAAPTVAQGTDSTTGVNTTSSTLDWTPFDTRDAVQNDIGPSTSLSTLSHTLEQQSVAIQKGATLVDRTTGAAVAPGQPIRPGQTLVRYTLNFQVSDYFALNDVFVRDVIGDGQRLYLGAIGGGLSSAPTLTVNNAFLTGAPGTRQTTSGGFSGTDVIEYQRRFNLGAASDPTSFDPATGPAGAAFNVLATSIQPDGPGSDAGTTFLQFNVSQELRARLGANAGRLVGAEIQNTGVGPENDNHPQTNPPPGAVTGTIVFYAEVTEEFSDSFRTANGGSNDPSVDQGDVLGNTVNDPRTPLRDGIFGDQISAATINSATPTIIGRGSDDSGTSLAIPYGVQSKVIAAINGQGVPGQGFANPPYAVQAGDRVTYLLTYTLPISRFENLRLVDFPPLPVMNLGVAPNNSPTFVRDPAAYGFLPGQVGVFVNGTTPGGVTDASFVSDTFFSTFAPGNGAGRNPGLSIDAVNNGLTLNFGTFEDLQDRSTVVSVLVTFTVGSDPFAADLFLTNQLRVIEDSTNAGSTTVEAIQRFELVRPTLSLYKGIVGTQQGAAAATGTTFGDVVFTGPGTAFGFSNQLNTVAEATGVGGASTASLDAGDRVRFALVAQNTGKGDAYDTQIRDVLPTGYVIPPSFPGAVFRGSGGAALVAGTDYTVTYNATTGEFVVTLIDNYTSGNVNSPTEDARSGAISRGLQTLQAGGTAPITNGSNAVVVLFDLTLASSVAPAQALTNTATVPQYSNSDGGPNYTNPAVVPGATIPTDTATVTVPTAGTKSIISTSEASTSEAGTGTAGSPRLMTVGEIVRYRLAFQLAEGTATNFQLRDNLPTGLTFLNDGTARVAFVSNAPITSTTLSGAGLNVVGSAAVAPTFVVPAGSISGGPFTTGVDPIFSLGTLVNPDNDTDAEFVVLEFNALLDNSAAGSNDIGETRDNTFTTLVNGTGVFTSGLVRVQIAEPSITNVLKSSNPTSGDAGDTVTFTVTFSNAAGATSTTAFDLVLTDVLPAVGYDNVAIVVGSLSAPTATNPQLSAAGNTVTFTADALPVGGTVSFQYTARLVAGVGPGFYRNTANLTYTSLPGTNGTTVNPTGSSTPGAPGTDTGERTGSGVGPNDLLDSDFEDVFVNVPVVKTIVSTNQAHTTGNTVAVGEQVVYRVVVTIPEGTTPSAVLRDALPAGMAVVSLDSLTATFDTGMTTDVAGGFPAVLAAAQAALAIPGQAFNFNLGSIVNADRDANAETLTFTYTVVVLNTAGNVRGATLTNSATFANNGVDRSTTSAPPVTVAEPTLRVDKTANPTTGDASNNAADAVTFTLVVDHAPASNAEAFNVSLSDLIPAGFTYVAGSLTNTAGVAPATLGESSGTLSATYTSLALGQSSTLTFRARLNSTTTPGQTVTNTAGIAWTSLPGDVTSPQSPYNGASVERTGAGGINNYVASDPAAVVVNTNSIAGNIYRDLNNNGVLDGGETLITDSIRVQLTGTDNLGLSVSTIITTTTGTYTFAGLRPGTYAVTQLDQPAGLLDGRDTPGTSSPGAAFGGTGTGALAARNPRDAEAITGITIGLVGNKAGINYNFGEVVPAQLGDFVWHDVNGNGRQDGGAEVGLNGVPVTLTGTDDSGQPVSLNTTTVTNAGNPGFYQFTNLRPSNGTGYVVTFGTLPGFVRTVRDSAVATDATDSDGDPTTGATAPVVLPPGGSIQTIDQGLYQPVSIGDRVYFDRDADGIQDAGEPGIPGATVQVVWLGPDGALGGGDDVTYPTVTTGVNGVWTVANLPPGSYRVTATPPAGQGWALTDSLDNGALSATNPVTVSTTSGVNLTNVDYGFRSTGSIGNRVYIDADGDGVQDANGLEPGLPGVTVTLRYDANADGDFTDPDDGLFTTVTDAAGAYTFPFLPPGSFQVSVAGAAGLPANVALTDSLDNGALSATATVTKVLALGENETTYDFGFQGNASLGDRAYYDHDGDGVQDANEPGVSGATVTAIWVGPDGAFGGGDDVTFTTTTDALGNYLFPGIPANALVGANPNYRVTVTNPAAFPVFTDSLDNGVLSATRPVDVQVSPTDLTPLNDRRDVDFGFRGTASLGDTVFLDSNGNGRQDGGTEVGIPGVSVTLYYDRNADGDFADAGEDVALATTTTGAGGIYAFTDLAAGNYQVVFGTLAGFARTVRDSAVATDATDSDADPATGRTGTYTLANGASNVTVDAGLYQPVSIGDRVYFDRDADGIQDAGEPGIPGATVQVVWLGPDGALGGGDDVTYPTVTTGVNGAWTVANLPPGSYRVTATPPAGQGWALTDSLDNGALSATNPVTVSTTSGVNLTNVDYGFRSTGSIGNRVYIDADGDGVQDANGLEPGLPGVTVTLRYDANADGDFTDPDDGLFTTVTDAAGAYTFPFLPPGAYQVSVAGAAGLPANVALTDSLDNGALSATATVTKVLALGENETTYDFGFQGNASLGDRAYYDHDGDGVQDANEPGVSGAAVTAIWVGPDGVFGGGDDVTFTTTTDALGNYLFPGIPANALAGANPNYRVTVTNPAAFPVFTDSLDNGVLSATRPVDVQVSPTDLTPLNDRRDVDFGFRGTASLGDTVFLDSNGNGRQDGGTEVGIPGVGVSLFFDRNNDGDFADAGEDVALATTTTGAGGVYAFTDLAAGNYQVVFGTLAGFARTVRDSAVATDATDSDADPVTGRTGTYTLANGASNVTVDAGLYQPVSIGDRVYFDHDGDGIQDAGEPGIPGATIQVVWLGPDGALGGGDDVTYPAVTTGVNGVWTVGNLPPGSYRVTATPPAGQGWALTDSLDNGALSATNPVTVSTTSGVNLTNVDYGFRSTGSIGNRVYIDADGDGVQDANGLEPGLPGVTVTLRYDANADGDFTDPDDGLFTTVTDAAGAYTFPFLPPGSFQVSVAGAAGLPANVALTDSLDNGALSATATVTKVLALGENETTYDFGFQGNASLGDRAYYDHDGDGVQDANEPGVSGAAVTAIWVGPDGVFGGGDDVTFTTTTDALGNYLFPGIPANALAGANPNYRVTVTNPAAFPVFTDSLDNGVLSATRPVDVQVSPTDLTPLNDRRDVDFGFRGTASLGDTVFLDSNGNGRQDGGTEVGIPGVGVSLFFDRNNDGDFADAGEDVALATTTTGAGGVYAFTDLAAGNYQVVFGTLAGFARTVRDSAVATDATDSDADPVTGRTGTYTLANGASNVTVDAGLYQPVSIGDRVYFDHDGDGIQDAGEPGIPGATIQVVWLGPDGALGGGDDVTYPAVTTGVNGVWTVGNLPPGSYQVTATPPAGQGWALTDSLDNGALSATNPVTVSTTSGVNLTNVDYGFRSTGSIGNRVYIDADGDGVQDANGLEPGLPGVTVTLRYDANADGDFTDPDDGLFTTVTDAAGAYSFTFLPPGSFQVSVAGAAGLPANVALTDSLDNGALSATATVTKTLALGENETTYDFGFQGNASLGDRAYYDHDGDGVQDANEPGVSGATVTAIWVGPDGAFGGGDDVTFTTTTDALGNYLFPGIPANALVGANPNYRVTVTNPAAFPVFTDSLDNGVLSATRPVDVQVSPTDLTPLNDRRDVDFGFRGTASLGDTVFLDSNGNGRQDGGTEVGIPGVSVTLYYDRNADGDFADPGEDVALATTTTGAGGVYAFTDLAAGNYQVVFGTLAGFARTVRDSAVATDATDSDADPATGRTATYTLANGDNNVTVDAGLYVPVSLGDRVYYDLNADGVQQPGELGVPGVGVQVVWLGPDGTPGGGDDLTFNTTTGANGIWTIGNLPPGAYQVTATPVEGIDQLTDSLDDGVLLASNPVVVSTTSGVDRTDVDFGLRGLGAVGDRVFLDVNANGTFDAGEGLDGVTVTLTGDLNGDGTPDTLTTTTAADGFYQFPFLRVTAAGVPYTVTVNTATLPQTGAGAPVTNTVDPDTASPGDNTSSLTLTSGAPSNQLQDFGYRGPGRIGDVVFLDANNNGLPDAGEGITGVVVRLRGDVDGDGTAEEFFATTTALGVYDFSNLPVRSPAGVPIAYTVTVDPNGTTLPAGVSNTADPDGGTDGTATLALDALPVNLAQDFGYRGPGSIGDRVFLDVNANGSFDPGEGLTAVTVTLTADLNGDGVPETLGTTTDADGFYQFTGLPVFQNNGTTAVPYVVTVVTGTLPAGLTNTVDPDTASPGDNTASLTLSAGAPTNELQDFGYRGTGVLGDRVWIDSNSNGIQDAVALEPGLPGVGLTLTWSGADDTFGTADDVTGTTTTDAAGAYTFNGLPLDLGRFRVEVTLATLPGNATQTFDLDGLGTPNSAGTAAPLTLTTAAPTRADVDFGYAGNRSLGDRVFVDQNRDGVQQATEGGIPGATVTLLWGGPDGDLATAADNVTFTTTTGANGLYSFPGLMVNGPADDYRVEVVVPAAGFTLTDSLDDGTLSSANPADVSLPALTARIDVDFGFAGNGSLAGVVFRDDSNDGTQDAGEPGIAGVVVTLTGTDIFGNPVLDPATGQPYTTTTDANGGYSFPGLPPGTYTITETQPAAYGDGIDRAGTLLGTAGNDVISGIVVGPNAAGTGYTFGERGAPISGTVFRDDNGDGAPQAGEPGIPGVRVELRDPGTGALITFTTTDANGNYLFENLPAGNYRIVEIQPPGYADGPVGPATVRDVVLPTTGLTDQNFAEVLGLLSGRVYVDTNANGTRDPGEPGLPGVTVTVTGTDLNGNPVSRDTVTGTDGTYTFLNLFPADVAGYTVTEGATPLYADRAANVGTGFATPGTAATPNQFTGVNLTPGQAGVDYDFGEVTGSLAGFVYADFDMNGVRTLSGPQAETGSHVPGTNSPGGIVGITVTLTGTDNAGTPVTRTTTTAADGSYRFDGLLAGTYTLTETQPPLPTTGSNGFYDGAETRGSAGGAVVAPSPTFTTDPNKNRIVMISLPAGVNGTDYNFGELPPADPFGFVYVDANRNGVRDAGERGIAGVPVSLSGTAFAGTPFARPLTAADVPGGLTQLTDANGRYEFVPIPAGLYTLTQDRQPAGFADGLESDADPNGPPATIGNEVISNIQLAPFPIRGPFNFGEVALPVAPGTLPPIDFFPVVPEDPSKRLFLTTTPELLTPPAAATAPNFAAFNPGPRPAALAAVAEGPGGTGLVRVFDFAGGNERFRFRPFGEFAGGARVTTADVTADGIPDVIVVPGVGGGPVVKVFDGNSGAEVRSFLAFEESFRGGLRVAAADINGDFVADIIVTPDTGGGPIVRAFDGATGAVIANFFALDPTFRGGLRVATGDINRDGTPDVVVTAGEGGGPRVAAYDGRTLGHREPSRLANDFFGFAPELRSGFWVSAADVDDDGFADVVMGAGAGGAPRVVVYSGQVLAAGGGPREVASFFAGEPADRGGARVLAADLDGDGRAEVVSGAGAGAWPLAYIFDPLTGLRRDVFYATSAPFRGGVDVG